MQSRKAKEEAFWKIWGLLGDLEGPILMLDLTEKSGLSEAQVYEILNTISHIGPEFKTQRDDSQNVWIQPPKDSSEMKAGAEFTVKEWMMIQKSLTLLKKEEPQAAQVIEKMRQQHPEWDYEKVIKKDKEHLKCLEKFDELALEKIQFFESQIHQQKCLKMSYGNDQVEAFPHRMLFINQSLSLVYEELQERSLNCLEIHNINTFSSLESEYIPNFSTKEVDSLIHQLQEINDDYERLVLKIKKHDQVELHPPFQHLGRPFVTTNLKGELIWSAATEMGPEIFHWLEQLGDCVEILGPLRLKEAYNVYLSKRHKTAV